ncbi:MAG: di-trans,poly-cis-decaprenylcistransferase [Chloroflexi bacterium]|nr:di-trans,poly-cis-decaprenylcistransferase [Chloroflexota bacterium]
MNNQISKLNETPGPRHVAIIMDGNGRWATNRGLPRIAGHKIGIEKIQQVLQCLADNHVSFVTLYAFSTENWNRPLTEVRAILNLMEEALTKQTPELHQKNIKVIHLGKVDRLNESMQIALQNAQDLTKFNTGVTLNVAFDYGGRHEILEAVRSLIREQIHPDNIDETLFSSHMYTSHCPDPDLVIRTGGELRISNFLLWQSAYSEYYHTSTYWPDLDSAEIELALESYKSRNRRFGRVDNEDE